MNFSPTKYERYAAALRAYTQTSVLKYGFTPKNCEKLKKIILFETRFFNNIATVDSLMFADELCSEIFITSAIKNAFAKTEIIAEGKVRLNYKSVFLLFGMICSKIKEHDTMQYRFHFAEDALLVWVFGIHADGEIKKTAARLGGLILCEKSDKKMLLVFPLFKPDHKVIKSNFLRECDIFSLFSKGGQ